MERAFFWCPEAVTAVLRKKVPVTFIEHPLDFSVGISVINQGFIRQVAVILNIDATEDLS